MSSMQKPNQQITSQIYSLSHFWNRKKRKENQSAARADPKADAK